MKWHGHADHSGITKHKPDKTYKARVIVKVELSAGWNAVLEKLGIDGVVRYHKVLPLSRQEFEHQRISRLSPARTVTFSRSKYSSNGIAYFREIPAISLNFGTSIRRSEVELANKRSDDFRFSMDCREK